MSRRLCHGLSSAFAFICSDSCLQKNNAVLVTSLLSRSRSVFSSLSHPPCVPPRLRPSGASCGAHGGHRLPMCVFLRLEFLGVPPCASLTSARGAARYTVNNHIFCLVTRGLSLEKNQKRETERPGEGQGVNGKIK